jgi:hypothetical protein
MNLEKKFLIFYSDICSIFCVLTSAIFRLVFFFNRYEGHDDVCVNLILSFIFVNYLQKAAMTGVK